MTPKELLTLWDECVYYYRNKYWGAYIVVWRRLLDNGWECGSPDNASWGF